MSKDTKTKSTNKILLVLFLTILSVSLILAAGIHLQIYAKKKSQSNHSSSSGEMSSISNSSNNTLSNKIDDGTNGINASQIMGSNLMNDSNCKHSDTKSCYNSGYSDGKANPGTSCPDIYSKTNCNGYNEGSKSEDNSDKFQDKSTEAKTGDSGNITDISITNNQSDFKDKNKPNLNPIKIDKTNDINNITNNQGIPQNIISDKVNKNKSNFDPEKLSKHKSKNRDTFLRDNDSKNIKQSIQPNLNPSLSNNTSDKVTI